MTRVVLFPTCVVDTVAGEVGDAVVTVLRRHDHDISLADGATCCGQPAWNAGYVEEAAAVARCTLEALSATGDAPICVPAGSCATMMRVYWPTLFDLVGDPASRDASHRLVGRVHEFSELLAADGVPEVPPGSSPGAVAYHHSCHMLRELGVEEQPEELLRRAGHDPVPWAGSRRCCGFGGTFAVKQPEISVAMADDKLDDLEGVDELVGCDTSCLLHLRGRAEKRGSELRIRHLAEVLAEAGS